MVCVWMHVRLDIGVCATGSVSRDALGLVFAKTIDQLYDVLTAQKKYMSLTPQHSHWCYLHGNCITSQRVWGGFALSVLNLQRHTCIQCHNNVIRTAFHLMWDSVCCSGNQLLLSLSLIILRFVWTTEQIKTDFSLNLKSGPELSWCTHSVCVYKSK